MEDLPARTRELLGPLLERLRWLLRADMVELLARYEESLESGDAQESGAECCHASRAQLGARRAGFAPAMFEVLERGCVAPAGAGATGGAAAGPALKADDLRLLDEDVLEEEGLLGALERRLASRASLPLMLLGQRFGVLLARPALAAHEVPFGPRAFCAALARASERLGLCTHERRALYRLYDVEFTAQYPRLVEGIDEALDEAGILRGLSYVPLRRRTPVALAVAQATETDALQAVNRAAEARAPAARIDPRTLADRNEALSAIIRFLMRHGRDSSQWSECLDVAGRLEEAACNGGDVPEDAEGWLCRAIEAAGHGPEDARRLASGLVAAACEPAGGEAAAADVDAPAGAEAPGAVQTPDRGVREQRCYERIVGLPAGAVLGFSAGTGGFLHGRLMEQYQTPDRLLLAVQEGGCDVVFEVDMLARLVASGQAWVVRHAGASRGAQA